MTGDIRSSLVSASICLLALVSRGCEAHRHDCVHDKVARLVREDHDPDTAEAFRVATAHLNAPTTRLMKAEREASGRKLLQTSNAQNLRMHAEYMLDDVDPSFAKLLQDQVVPRAMRALSRALQLRAPVQGNLKLPRTCATINSNTGKCASVGEMCWGGLPQSVPEEYYGESEVCGGLGCITGEDTGIPGGIGIPDADFAVFVTAYASAACSPTTGAHAVTCSRDTENWYGLPQRPLVGFINFCPPAAGDNIQDVKKIDGLVDTATHELIHTLFMSSNLYQHYINADGSALGATVSDVISTPSVRQATRDHFNCPTAAGAPLEQDGGDATKGSHWESTTFQSEIMIGASAAVERRVLSSITLGLAQDSGWYLPNWESQGFLRHGNGVGCDMLESCTALGASSPAQQFYCDPAEPPACLYYEKASWCTDTALTDCSILQPLNNGDCKNPANMLTRLSSASATEVGIYYGPQAICIGVPTGQLSRGFRTWPVDEACVASKCEDDGTLSVLIKELTSSEYKSLPCPEGEEITLSVSDGFAPDTRLGPCPKAIEVCPYKGCAVNQDLMCSLQGNCFEGKCYCAVDKSGEDCSQTLCESDQGCLDGQHCSDSHECTWGVAPPPPPPGAGFTDTLVTDFGSSDFKPMRAVRVGYLQQCVFFDDADGDFTSSISTEKSQPTGPKGEVVLYVLGESDTTSHAILQDSLDPSCIDLFTSKKNSRIVFSIAPGVAIQDSTVGPLSTAAALEMAAANKSRSEAAQTVATAYGLPAPASVHGKDWLQVMTAESSDEQRKEALGIGLVSIATVLTAEQIAAFLAGDDLLVAYNISNAVLRQITATAGGDVISKVQDPTWVTSTITYSAQTVGVAAPDTAKAQRVADAIVLVNKRLVEIRDSEGAGDPARLLTGWAKAAHVGDVMFAAHAAKLGAGEMDDTEFKNRTSAQALSENEAAYDIDLSDATLLEDPSFFNNARESIQEWLRADHFGLYGWVWVGLGGVALFLFCCACSCCTSWSKKRLAKKAVQRELQQQHQLGPRYTQPGESPIFHASGTPLSVSNGANGQQMPRGWDSNPRNYNGGVTRAASNGTGPYAVSDPYPVDDPYAVPDPYAVTPSSRPANTQTRSPNRARTAQYDPLAAPTF